MIINQKWNHIDLSPLDFSYQSHRELPTTELPYYKETDKRFRVLRAHDRVLAKGILYDCNDTW